MWFREGLNFIKSHKNTPFFLYLPLNAPHGPYYVDPKWVTPYKRKEVTNPNFYGMIANIDHNLDLMRKQLDELGLAENTILIFMTDNGTSSGAKFAPHFLEGWAEKGYNAGLRGKKSSIYEGGTQVPFFIHWPAGQLVGGKDVNTIGAHIDILPTLADLCSIEVPAEYDVNGLSLRPLLYNNPSEWTREYHVEQFHGGAFGREPLDQPQLYSAVMSQEWRYITTNKAPELYNIVKDPAQRENVVAHHPEIASKMQAEYDKYWGKVHPELMRAANIDIGNPVENPTILCSQDWFSPRKYPPFAFSLILKYPKVTYPWLVNVYEPGTYRFTMAHMPKESDHHLKDVIKAQVKIDGKEASIDVQPGEKSVSVELKIDKAGPQELWTYLTYKDNSVSGAYFTTVEKID